MNVLIIPEDFRKDQYMLKPIVTAMLKQLGKPKARVKVCQDPLLGGIGEATKWDRIAEIISQYAGMVNLFLLCVDRDGKESRKSVLTGIEQKATEVLSGDRCFLAENAWQEIEVWVLAGHDLPKDWTWQEIRSEPNPKEQYFLPFATQRDLLDFPDQGRKTLAEEAVRRYERIRQLCPEDLVNLETRIAAWLEEVAGQ